MAPSVACVGKGPFLKSERGRGQHILTGRSVFARRGRGGRGLIPGEINSLRRECLPCKKKVRPSLYAPGGREGGGGFYLLKTGQP